MWIALRRGPSKACGVSANVGRTRTSWLAASRNRSPAALLRLNHGCKTSAAIERPTCRTATPESPKVPFGEVTMPTCDLLAVSSPNRTSGLCCHPCGSRPEEGPEMHKLQKAAASRRSSPLRVGTPMDRGRLRALQGKGCPPPLEFSGAATTCPYPRTEDLGPIAPICGVSTIDFQRGRSNRKIGKRQAAALQTG